MAARLFGRRWGRSFVWAAGVLWVGVPGPDARAQWSVTVLGRNAEALAASAEQIGGHAAGRATVWNSQAGTAVDLGPGGGPGLRSMVFAANGTQQGGATGVESWYSVLYCLNQSCLGDNERASLWQGSAESRVELHPAGAVASRVSALGAGYQAGHVQVSQQSVPFSVAALWTGTAGSFVSLHPENPPGWEESGWVYSDSAVTAAAGARQGGWVSYTNFRNGAQRLAGLWSGTSQSWTLLGRLQQEGNSAVLGMSESTQVGYRTREFFRADGSYLGSGAGAVVWRGSVESRVDLQPPASMLPEPSFWYTFFESFATAAAGEFQVGHVIETFSPSGPRHRAALWAGSAESYLDLHAYLPSEYNRSLATGIVLEGGTIRVSGIAYNDSVGRVDAVMWSGPCSPPTITSQPQSVATEGTTVALSVAASAASPLTYRWQWRPVEGDGEWVDLRRGTNATTVGAYVAVAVGHIDDATLVVRVPVPAGLPAPQFRCVVTNACGLRTVSDAATVTFGDPTDPVGWTPPVIDGVRDAVYGAPLHVQTTQTHFGDNTLSGGQQTNGSELANFSARILDDVLYLHLAGNLETNGNNLEVFIDSAPGGQNTLLGDTPYFFLNPMGAGNGLPGLRFDAGFSPDHLFNIRAFPGQMFLSMAELRAGGGGFGLYVGTATAGGSGVLAGGDLPSGVRLAFNNTNVAGVAAGTGAADVNAAAAVTTGIELAIPLSVLNLNTVPESIKVTAFVNGYVNDFVSNQVIGSVPPGTANLGEPRAVDFSAVPGDQFVTVVPTTRAHAGWTAHTLLDSFSSLWAGGAPVFGRQLLASQSSTSPDPIIYRDDERLSWWGPGLRPPGSIAAWGTATDGFHQVGVAQFRVGNLDRFTAALWRGTVGSYVNLNPPSATGSYVFGALGFQQVGGATFESHSRAGFWRGTPTSWTSLHPPEADASWVYATNGWQQGGTVVLPHPEFSWRYTAALWSGTEASRIDLHPASAASPTSPGASWVYAMSGHQQAGSVSNLATGQPNASLWSGTPESWVNLNPPGSFQSIAFGVSGGHQAGYVAFGGPNRAALWAGSAESWIDLHQFLPPNYAWSEARGLWTDSQNAVVVGVAGNITTGRQELVRWVGPLVCSGSGAGSIPTISSQPESLLVCADRSATMSVTVAAAGPVTYVWQHRADQGDSLWTNISEGVNSLGNGSGGTFMASGTSGPELTLSGFVLYSPGSPPFSQARGLVRCLVLTPCGHALSEEAGLRVSDCIGCNPSDIADTAGEPGPDLCVNNGDFQLFFTSFFAALCEQTCGLSTAPCNPADIASTDGTPGADGCVDNGDFALFFTSFFSAVCPQCPG